jgi:glucuronokinase
MRTLRGLAHDARAALQDRDHASFTRCLDRSFDARRSMVSLDPQHVEMVEVARASGAGANYTGSGGAVVVACRDERQRAEVLDALRVGGSSVLAIDPV